MDFPREKWVNVSESSSLPGYYQRTLSLDETDFNKRYSNQTPLLVPPKFRGTPLDIITDLGGPYGVDLIYNLGLMAVSEFCNHCISIWDLKSMKKVNTIGSAGTGAGQFCFPAGIAMTPRDNILVADCYNDRVQEVTLDGKCVSCVGNTGTGISQFNKPRGITFDNTGLIFVADRYNHRVQVFNPDLTFSHSFGSFGANPGHFNTPYDISFDSHGHVYVTDCGNNRIQKFTREGRLLSMFGMKGKRPGELNGPTGIYVDDDDAGIVFVTEYLNGRISMFTVQGDFIDTKLHKKLKDPYGVKYNSLTGHLIVTDFSHNRLVILERKS